MDYGLSTMDYGQAYNDGMSFPQVTVAPSAAKRVRHGDCWVFRDELRDPLPSVANGELVELTDEQGTFLAYAFSSMSSSVAARVLSTERAHPWNRALLAERLTAAIEGRRAV